ncbi:MAG: FAD-binding protein [Chloroflexi bacterium]|nr:FAD-binding protein [Chloroflexota bacterium]
MTAKATGGTVETDVLVIGSGGAGLYAAIEAARNGQQVMVLTKGVLGKNGATLTSGADFNLDGHSIRRLFGFTADPRDAPEILFEDTINVGEWINNQKLVETLVDDAPQRVKELVDWGTRMEGLAMPARPGCRYPHGVKTTGLEISNVLAKKVKQLGQQVTVRDNIMATDLLTSNGRVVGAVGLDFAHGDFVAIKAKAVVIATGGGQEIFPIHTYPKEMSGDGQAMGYRAGAELLDMESMQFITMTFLHPYPPTSARFLILFMSNGGWLLNKHGQRFMSKWDPQNMEDARRSLVAVAVNKEILEGRGWKGDRGGYVALSMRHLPEDIIDYLSGDWYIRRCLFSKRDFDHLKKDSIEAFIAPHSFQGGLRVDENGSTTLAGLFAAGEVTGGLHGADRLAGNAVSQCFVQGSRAGRSAARFAAKNRSAEVNKSQLESLREKVFAPLERKDGVSPLEMRRRLQKLASEKLINVRSGESLEKAVGEIEEMKKSLPRLAARSKNPRYNREWVAALEAENSLVVAEMIARSALMRTESRGNHYRYDFPATDNQNWLKNIILRRVDTKMRLFTAAPPGPLHFARVTPPER